MKQKLQTSNEPLAWLLDYDPHNQRNDIISWFNNKMDMLVNKLSLLQYNNPDNRFLDVVHELSLMAAVAIAPDINSKPKDIEYFNTIISGKDDFNILVNQYCLIKFNKTTK